jgi:phenylalanyl-tRNA synthetase alpha chain
MDWFEKANQLLAEAGSAALADESSREKFRIRFLGSKNVLKELFAAIQEIPAERKKEFGALINQVKLTAEKKLQESASTGSAIRQSAQIDVTKPGEPMETGSRHPVSIVRHHIISIFQRIGFAIATGPEIEDEWHNFTALNMPADHPARDMNDTFYISQNPDWVLRSQTSTVQIRVLEELVKNGNKPPVRIIVPGRCYRNETITFKHHVFFHQVEGLYVAENVSFADLKQTMYYFFMEFYGEDFEYRFRPSYFPFTEPSAELDIRRKGTEKWMEILGCGMVHPAVLENCGIDSGRYNGYAWGMGIERQAMLRYGIHDIRIPFQNDVRFLQQFKAAW